MDSMRPNEPPPLPMSSPPITDRQAYNLVSDVVVGFNVRKRDNLYQAAAIFICLLLGLPIGYFVATDKPLGLIVGGFVGLLVGLLGSGTVLGIYRAVRHYRGQHD